MKNKILKKVKLILIFMGMFLLCSSTHQSTASSSPLQNSLPGPWVPSCIKDYMKVGALTGGVLMVTSKPSIPRVLATASGFACLFVWQKLYVKTQIKNFLEGVKNNLSTAKLEKFLIFRGRVNAKIIDRILKNISNDEDLDNKYWKEHPKHVPFFKDFPHLLDGYFYDIGIDDFDILPGKNNPINAMASLLGSDSPHTNMQISRMNYLTKIRLAKLWLLIYEKYITIDQTEYLVNKIIKEPIGKEEEIKVKTIKKDIMEYAKKILMNDAKSSQAKKTQ